MTPEEREALEVLHALAKATECLSRHLFNLNELLREVLRKADIPPTDQG